MCASARPEQWRLKPASVTFEQAASVPIAGITALQGLRDKGKVQPGQKVLINGASGGVGTFAVQIAKSFGADVTGVCSTRNLDMVRSLGADHVIDYTKEDFTKGDQRYDVILDNVANHSLSECRRVLNPDGRYVLIGGGGVNESRWLGPGLTHAFKAMFLSKFVSQKMGMMLAELNQKDLTAPGRSYAVRQGHAGHRQNLQVKRASEGYPIFGTRPRSRQSSGKGGLATESCHASRL